MMNVVLRFRILAIQIKSFIQFYYKIILKSSKFEF